MDQDGPTMIGAAALALPGDLGSLPEARPRGDLALERHDSFEAIADEWDALADRIAASPFVRPGWLRAWHDALGTGTPMTIAVRRGDRLAGVLPLVRRHRALRSPTNWHTPLFEPVVADPPALDQLAGGLYSSRAPRFDLSFLTGDSPELAALERAARAAGRRVARRTVASQPYVDLSGSFADYEATLPRKQRKEARRLERRLREEGELRLEVAGGRARLQEVADGRERLEELLEEGFAIEGSGWKAEGGSAISSRAGTDRFYREIARWAAAEGWLRLWFLRLDGRAIAFDYALEHDGVVYVLKGGFDHELRSLGPGAVLTYKALERSFDEGLRSYEFLGGADHYKLGWSHGTRERVRLQAFSRSPAGFVQRMVWTRARRPAQRALTLAKRARRPG